MDKTARACGRPDCTECPKQRIGRCKATPQQRDAHECVCGLCKNSCKAPNQQTF